MTVEELAAAVLNACDAEGTEHLVVGAFAGEQYALRIWTSWRLFNPRK
jgi:hypothetical protein